MIKFNPNQTTSVIPPQTVAAKPSVRSGGGFQLVVDQNDRMAGSVPIYDGGSTQTANIAESGDSSGGFSFFDFVDIINPLQHIPLVSNLYQSMTGDTIGAVAQIVGGGLFGGPIGALTSAGIVAYKAAGNSENKYNETLLSGLDTPLADRRSGFLPYNT